MDAVIEELHLRFKTQTQREFLGLPPAQPREELQVEGHNDTATMGWWEFLRWLTGA